MTAGAVIVALAVLSQGVGAPFSRDDFLNVERVQDVVERGHWLIIHDSYPEYPGASDRYGVVSRKPPLFYWCSALAVEASGRKLGPANVRAVSVLAAAALAIEVVFWTSARMGESCGILAFLFLLGSYAFDARATVVIPGMLLSLLVFGAYCMMYPALEGAASNRRALGAGGGLGLAILTKGPVALVLCALGIAVYLVMTGRRPWAPLATAWPWVTLVVSLAVAACWYVPAILAVPRLFDVFVTENLGHFLSKSMGGTGEARQPVYFISLKLLGGAMPLTFLVPALALTLVSKGRNRPLLKPVLFQLALLLSVLVLFSAASSKRTDYILPAMPSLAIVLAWLFAPKPAIAQRHADYADRLRDGLSWLVGIVTAALIAGLWLFFLAGGKPGQLPLHLHSSDRSYAAIFAAGTRHLLSPFFAAIGATIIGAAIIWIALAQRRSDRRIWFAGFGLALQGIAAVSLWTGTIRPALDRQRSLKTFAAEIHRTIGDATLYVTPGSPVREIAFYYPGQIRLTGRAAPEVADGQPAYVVASSLGLAEIDSSYRARLRLVLQAHAADQVKLPSLYQLAAPPAAHSHQPGAGP